LDETINAGVTVTMAVDIGALTQRHKTEGDVHIPNQFVDRDNAVAVTVADACHARGGVHPGNNHHAAES
jgi:hypothetical protein